MATHSSILAWEIPWTGKPGRLQSIGSQRVRHYWMSKHNQHIWGCWCFSCLSWLIPVCNSSSPAFLMMCSAYRLNKQGNSREPCGTPFSILNQSVVPYRVLSAASQPAFRFLRRQVRWSGIPISLRAFQKKKSFPQFVTPGKNTGMSSNFLL